MCSNTSVKPKVVGLVSSEKSAKKRRTPKGRSDRAYLKKQKKTESLIARDSKQVRGCASRALYVPEG